MQVTAGYDNIPKQCSGRIMVQVLTYGKPNSIELL